MSTTPTPDRDADLDTVVALARAIDLDRDAFAQILNEMDCTEHHRAIIRLVHLASYAYGGADGLAAYVEALQTVGGHR